MQRLQFVAFAIGLVTLTLPLFSFAYYDDYPDSRQEYYYSPQQSFDDGYYQQPRHASRQRQRTYYYEDDDDGYYYSRRQARNGYYREYSGGGSYSSRLPGRISTSEKTIVIDPRVHAWGAYSADGSLIKAGLVTAGGRWCPDIGRPCRTRAGSFRINSLGSHSCKSHKYPLGRGGAPMPYCMFFNGGQGLHGSYEVVEGNVSHGCVRMHVGDAEWLRYNFANVGTKVIVRPY